MPIRPIDRRDWSANQSWKRISVFELGEHTLRVQLEHNAYMNQSKATIQRWNGDRWSDVAFIPPSQMASWKANFSYVERTAPKIPFDADENVLTELAARILKVIP